MNDRLDTVKRLAEDDPYFKGYLDGLTDSRHIVQEAASTTQD